MRRALLALCLLAVAAPLGADRARRQAPLVSQDTSAAAPLYVLIETTFDDPWNLDATEERLRRTLALVDRYRRQYPSLHVSCLARFSGTMADSLAERNKALHLLDQVRQAEASGLVEIGYDGTDEPTFIARPRPNMRGAKTPEARWLARSQAAEWFLNEYKDPITGAPDPERPGGLRRVREVFGDVRFITGVSLELGGDSEIVHQLRRQPLSAVIQGLTENTAWPARLLHGYRGGLAMFSADMSPGAEYVPELYWQDNVLRLSSSSGAQVRTFDAVEGPEALGKLLDAVDRSRPHVVRVRLGHPSIYMKPGYAGGKYENPLQYVYDNPKGARMPEEGWQPPEETEAAYHREEAAVGWLCERFFAANPGSRFVAVGDLMRRARTSVGRDVGRDTLTASAASLVRDWTAIGQNPPNFVRGAGEDFSLADMFQMLASALAVRERTGALPQTVPLRHVYGPLEMTESEGPGTGAVGIASVLRSASELAPRLESETWAPVPPNVIPSRVELEGIGLNAAQFLRLMAEAYLSAPGDTRLGVERSYMFSGFGEGFPRTRQRSETGASWTLKPARLAPES